MNTRTDQIRQDILAGLNRDCTSLEDSLRQADLNVLAHMRDVRQLITDCFAAFFAHEETHKRLSAFAIYQIEAIHLVERACMQALCWYYGIGTAMLRMALEALVRGAFCEGMAHKGFRDRAEIVRRAPGVKLPDKTGRLPDWFTDIFANHAQAESDLETMSAAVFDRVSALFYDPVLSRAVPPLKVMVDQIARWQLLAPIGNEHAASAIYDGVYWKLSDDAHVVPDKTLLGRRFAAGREAFRTVEFNAEELSAFIEMLEVVSDIAILLALNLVAQVINDVGFRRESARSSATQDAEKSSPADFVAIGVADDGHIFL
jgi:hypothetical protein